ncbi:hypothetical protein HPB49_017048 [Dermacentor silvarum]|uniref:Uncharacterized protein n=1 Tax=Dermacentor silvarum TaxID=543639 RepID=A0ACB8CYN3_DERSI|nr:hypothetical protein HPB49_017048 [Dermacentor silvarum]
MPILVAHPPFYLERGTPSVNYGALGASFARALVRAFDVDSLRCSNSEMLFPAQTIFLMTHDPEMFRKYYRMTPKTFGTLNSMLETRLSKQWVLREPVPSRCRLAITMRCVENALGVLASRFRIFRRPTNLLPENARSVTLAACALHNFLRDDVSYIPERYVDEVDNFGNFVEGQWRQEAEENAFLDRQHHGAHNYTKSAAETRDVFCSYFVHEGAVPWQRERCDLPP